MFWPEITPDPDPMRLVREARERGEEPTLVTGLDGGALVVFWFIPSTGQIVVEGSRSEDEA